MIEKECIIGIDLGTTNSEVAVIKNDKIEIISENDHFLVPSYVSLSSDNQILVGDEARNSYVLHPERTIKSIKRKMGSGEKVKLGDREYLPQEISSMILKELKQRAERYLGTTVSKAVITVPAYFSDAQRQATRDAGSIAGLEVVRILNEPTAACLAFEHEEEEQTKTILAFDLGGGTFDVSIVRMEGELVEVIGSHGDNQLGGDDFDDLIYQYLITKVYDNQDRANSLTPLSENRIRRAAEMAKIRLTDEYYCKIIEENLDTISGGKEHLNEEFSREQFEKMSKPLVARTLTSVHQALAAAGKKPKDIDEVILVGGSTRMPVIFEFLKRELKKTPRHDIHPDLAVVYGAAVMAGRLMGKKDQRILVDITPYTFGTTAYGYLQSDYVSFCFVPIIEAGTPLPVRRTKQFYTMADGQEKCECSIFQGEHEDARKNIMVGQFIVDGLSSSAPEGSPITVHMDLDFDGILRVTATEKCTGLSKNVVIEKSLEKLDQETLRKSKHLIADLFGEGKTEYLDPTPIIEAKESDGIPKPTLPSARIKECNDLLNRVEKNKGTMDEVDAKDANILVKDLKAAMQKADEQEISRIFTELEDLLFYVETN